MLDCVTDPKAGLPLATPWMAVTVVSPAISALESLRALEGTTLDPPPPQAVRDSMAARRRRGGAGRLTNEFSLIVPQVFKVARSG